VTLPGEVTCRPGEAYRLAADPEKTTDDTLAVLSAVGGLPGLEAIDLSRCAKVTDAGVVRIVTRFPNLEAISLSGAERVTQAVVPYLARLRRLRAVALPPRADTTDVRLELAKRVPGCRVI
jgi:hypothetical protein